MYQQSSEGLAPLVIIRGTIEDPPETPQTSHIVMMYRGVQGGGPLMLTGVSLSDGRRKKFQFGTWGPRLENLQRSGVQLSERIAPLGIIEAQLRAVLKPLEHQCIYVTEGLKEALNCAPIVTRDAVSQWDLLQRGYPLMPNGAFNICCPRDCVSRTANVERTCRYKWVNVINPIHEFNIRLPVPLNY